MVRVQIPIDSLICSISLAVQASRLHRDLGRFDSYIEYLLRKFGVLRAVSIAGVHLPCTQIAGVQISHGPLNGEWLNLVERLLWEQKVARSNRVSPTSSISKLGHSYGLWVRVTNPLLRRCE